MNDPDFYFGLALVGLSAGFLIAAGLHRLATRHADRMTAAYELGVEEGYAEGWAACGRQYNADDVRWSA